MQKYGMLKDGELLVSDILREGYKPIEYAPIPKYDQSRQCVEEGEITESETSISVEYAVRELTAEDESVDLEETDGEFVEREPWHDTDEGETERQKEIEVLKAQNQALADRAEFVEELIFEMALQVYQ